MIENERLSVGFIVIKLFLQVLRFIVTAGCQIGASSMTPSPHYNSARGSDSGKCREPIKIGPD